MRIVRLGALAVLSVIPAINSCASGESRSRSDAEVMGRNYIAENCKRFVLNGAQVEVQDFGDEIGVLVVPGNIDEAERQANLYGGFLVDPEVRLLFKKNPLKIVGVGGCRKYN